MLQNCGSRRRFGRALLKGGAWSLAISFAGVRLAGFARPLVTGDEVPNEIFTNQLGQSFEIAQFKGRALAVTFFFTRCPLPDYCPRLAGNFKATAALLVQKKAWHLLSISFDPEHDTPERLLEYSRTIGADLNCWTFACAKENIVRDWGQHFGLKVDRKEGLLDHNLRTAIIDAKGRVQHLFEGSQWTPRDLAWELEKAMLADR